MTRPSSEITVARFVGATSQGAEASLALHTHLIRDGTGRSDWHPRAVHFRHRAPRSATPQRRFFGCPVGYKRRRDELVIAAADLRLAFRTADETLLPILLRHADVVLAQSPTSRSFDNDVRRLVLSSVGSGDVSVEQIGAQLGISPQTAFLLGYSDLSAFSRAFRRWTGESARAYRRAKLGPAT